MVGVAAANHGIEQNAQLINNNNYNNNNPATRLHQRFLNTLAKKRGLDEDDVGNVDCSTAIVDWTTCLLSNCLSEMDTCEEEETIGMLTNNAFNIYIYIYILHIGVR